MKSGCKFASGRPATGRTHAISVRISQEAANILNTKKNKSEYIDGLIKFDGLIKKDRTQLTYADLAEGHSCCSWNPVCGPCRRTQLLLVESGMLTLPKDRAAARGIRYADLAEGQSCCSWQDDCHLCGCSQCVRLRSCLSGGVSRAGRRQPITSVAVRLPWRRQPP